MSGNPAVFSNGLNERFAVTAAVVCMLPFGGRDILDTYRFPTHAKHQPEHRRKHDDHHHSYWVPSQHELLMQKVITNIPQE